MTWDDIDLNSIIIIVGAICIGVIKIIEMWKSGSYRSTKLTNSKEEMKQVEELRNKYREKFKRQIENVKKDMIDEIQNKTFNDEFDKIIGRLVDIYNNTNELITSRSDSASRSNSEDIVEHKKIEDNNKLIELEEIKDKRRTRAQSRKEEITDKIKKDILKGLSEHIDSKDVEIDMVD